MLCGRRRKTRVGRRIGGKDSDSGAGKASLWRS